MRKRIWADAEHRDIVADDGSRSSQFALRAELHDGILPSPEALAAYEALHPGLIVWMMERVLAQQTHRMAIEKVAITSSARLAVFGQLFGFVLGLGTLAVGAYGFYSGFGLAGLGSVALGIGAIAGAYIAGVKRQSEERIQKHRLLHGLARAASSSSPEERRDPII